MSAARLTEGQKQEILTLYIVGARSAGIAERFGVHHSYPGLLAKRRGVKARRSDVARVAMSNAAFARRLAGAAS